MLGVGAVSLATAVVLVPSAALGKGEAAELDAATKTKAALKFKEGEKAFKRHEYAAAAAAFEEAHSIAPHPAALFNAATAHQKAGKLTRAANLCARYLRDAPDDDSRRDKANELIGELTPKLGRVEVEERGASEVELDSRPLEGPVTYVDPGDHMVTGRFGEKGVQRKISVVAGSLARVVLEPPKKAVSAGLEEDGEEHDAVPRAGEDAGKEQRKPLAPTLFFAGLGATVVFGGVTVWSGLDTNKARDDYDQHPTPGGLDDGRSKQRRTNLLLGATAVIGVGTGVIGAFFTDWKGKPKPSRAPEDVGLSIGPGFVGAHGSFQ